MQKYDTVYAMVKATRPEHPVYCLRPSAVTIATRWFLEHFPGRVLFAVKTNPDFVATIAEAGVTHFDVASLGEIELVAEQVPSARMSFMHPVKSREAIRRAYFEFGIRDFALDSEGELDKILEETENADDLNLFIRLSVTNRYSTHPLSGKFGVTGKPAAQLLFRARQHACKLGICFHAGSQLMHPDAFREAMRQVSRMIIKSGVIIDILDVGGGFPSVYPGLKPPPLADYMRVIHDCFEDTLVLETCELWCEPGRALVAEGASLVVRVELRKDNALYLNDGTYGGLFDAGHCSMVFPVRHVASPKDADDEQTPMGDFKFFGPTCDSIDAMAGPFRLPENISEGDYIEVDNMGAYSVSLRTDFNSFGKFNKVVVDSVPLYSMYGHAIVPEPKPAGTVKRQVNNVVKHTKPMIMEKTNDAG